MVQNRLPSIPVDVDGVPSFVGGKPDMKWLQKCCNVQSIRLSFYPVETAGAVMDYGESKIVK
jgi:hypothetical protein